MSRCGEGLIASAKEARGGLSELLAQAKARYDALSSEDKAEHDRKQRESWVRGMMTTGDPRLD